MKYEKPPTSIEKQITRLQARGMLCDDIDLVRRWLTTVGYYRLSAYWLPMEDIPNETDTRSKQFKDDCKFEDVVNVYIFDRKLRLLIMEAVERIEIAVRSRWTYYFTHEYGAHGYLDCEKFNASMEQYKGLAKIAENVTSSNELFIKHYKGKYTEPVLPPLWAVTEIMSLGELSKWYSRTKDNRIRQNIAREIGAYTKESLDSILQVLTLVRNICAHHGRLWNRKTVKRLRYIKKFRDDLVLDKTQDQPNQLENKLYNVLIVLLHLMRNQSEETTFPLRLFNLLTEVSDTNLEAMGFPEDWKNRNICCC